MNKQTEALEIARNFICAEWGFGGSTDIEPSKIVRMLEEALADGVPETNFGNMAEQPAQQQEPVLWQILNGVCHAGVRSTENLAREAAAGMQKAHDLGGSLAAFHVRPLYTSPPASKPWVAGKTWVGLTDEEKERIRNTWGLRTYKAIEDTEAKLREKNGG